MSDAGGRLDTWKQIGDYLGQKNERTARRWAAERGLPVHRVPGGKRASVYALKSEIDVWLQRNESPKIPAARRWSRPVLWAGVSTLVLIGVLAAARSFEFRSGPPRLIVTKVAHLTKDGTEKTSIRFGANTVFYIEKSAVGAKLMSVPAAGGPVREIPTPVSIPQLKDADYRTGRLLIDDGAVPYDARRMWILGPDGSAQRFAGKLSGDPASWSPDGKEIAFWSDDSLDLASPDDRHIAELLIMGHTGNIVHLAWSPEEDRLRFLDNATDSERPIPLELALKAGAQARPLNLGANCCETWAWTPGGFFYMTKLGSAGGGRLRMVRTGQNATPEEIALPASVESFSDFAIDWEHRSLFLLENIGTGAQIFRGDSHPDRLTPIFPGLQALDLDFSPDGQWIAYVRLTDHTLWRRRTSGGDEVQLTKPPAFVELPRWSPDGSKIAFTSMMPGASQQILVIPRDGGLARKAVQGADDQGGPTWSPDGRSIAYGNVYCEARHSCSVQIVRLQDSHLETLPDSQGLRTARWSPDGRSIAALRSETRQIRIFDVRRRQWRTLAGNIWGDNLAWSRDSNYIYASDKDAPDPKILRIRLSDGEQTTAADLSPLKASAGSLYPWFGLAPDGSLILLQMHSTSEIVRADW